MQFFRNILLFSAFFFYLYQGQERFQAVSKLYVRGALGCVVVTDIMNSASLSTATTWKDIVEENCDYIDTKPIPIVLVQNKCDLISKLGKLEDYMNLEIAEKEAKNNKFLALFQTSAKNNQNLDAVFETLTENILQRNLINDELINFEDKGKKANNGNNNNNGNQRVPDPNIRLNNQNNRSSPAGGGGSGKSGCC